MSKKRSASITETKLKPHKIKKTPETKQSPEKTEAKTKTKTKTKTKSNKNSSKKSVAPLIELDADIDFPRGGGIPLTPYQQAEARRDGTQQAERLVSSSTVKPHSSKRPRSSLELDKKKPKLNGTHDHIPDSYRIEHLNSKRLLPGIKLAGIIIQITPLALIVALPSQLVAHVPISEISSFYTKRLEENAEEDEVDSQNSTSVESEDSLLGLNQMFFVGQWIRCSVLNNNPTAAEKNHKLTPLVRAAMKVTLTLDPAQVNSGIDISNLPTGMTLTGAVRSIEDRGYIVDFGIPINSHTSATTSQTSSNNLTAFVSFDQASQFNGSDHKDNPSARWEIGHIISCRISKLSENGATCVVSVNPKDVSKSVLTAALNIDSILPLHMVSCQVTAVVPSRGLNVTFLGFFKGTINFSHLGLDETNELALNEKFKVGQKLSARVLWDTIPSKNQATLDDQESILGPKIFSLSLLDHVIKQELLGIPSELKKSGESITNCHKIDQLVEYPVGYVFQTIKIHRVEDEWGVYVTCLNKVDGHPIDRASNDKLPTGFVHISAMNDSFVPSLSATTGAYKIGSTHKARVTGISLFDGCLQLSLQPSILDQSFIRPEDIPAGELIEVTVKRLTTDCLVVKIHDRMDGIVWPDHYADVQLRKPERKFIPGAKFKARVLYTVPEKHRVVLTLRKTLLNSDTDIITSYESARVGMITNGVVSKVNEKSMSITFFGHTRGVVPIKEADENFVESLPDLFSPGQPVKVKITLVNARRKKIYASLRLTAPDKIQKASTILDRGDQVSAFVSKVGKNHVKLNLYHLGAYASTSHPAKGLISLTLLASKQGLSPDDLKSQLKEGDEIHDLTVTGEDEMKKLLIVGFQSPPLNLQSPSNQVTLAVGDQVTGLVRFVHDKNLVLDLSRENPTSTTEPPLEGFLSIALLARIRQVSIDELKKQDLIGQEISGLQVIHADEERGLLVVGFPNLGLEESNSALDIEHLEPQPLSTSDRVIGRIFRIGKNNLKLDLRKEGTEGYADAKGIISIEKVAQHRHINVTELRSALRLGDYITELMVRKKTPSDSFYLLTFKPADKKVNPASVSVPSQTITSDKLPLSVGDSVVGTVQVIHGKNILFSLEKAECNNNESSKSAVGIMSAKVLAGHWHIDPKNLKDRLKEGQRLQKLTVNKINPYTSMMIVGFAPASTHVPPIPDEKISPRMLLNVCITRRNSEGLQVTPVDISPENWTFCVDYPDINDDYDEKITLEKGSIVSAMVVRIDNQTSTIYLSTRPSDLNKSNTQSLTIKDPAARSTGFFHGGRIARGFIQKISNHGLILQVGTGIRGTVPISKLPPDWKTRFQIGQVVSTRATSSTSKTLFFQLCNGSERVINWQDLEIGQVFDVFISKFESYGMFLQLPRTGIRGLCHAKQIYDDEKGFQHKFKQDVQNKKFVGEQRLKASILIIDKENKKLGFTIKPSVVGNKPSINSASLENVEENSQKTDDSAEEDSDDSTNDEPSHGGKASQGVNQAPTVSIDFSEPSLPLSTGFLWNANQSKQTTKEGDSDEESTHGDFLPRKSKSNSGMNGNPAEEKTVDELEKCLLESPNSSQLWNRLIHTYIQKADINKARETAKRALEAIHYREESEKWKVWICLLNLENTYGTEEQFSKTFKEASVCNDIKTVWLKVAEIYAQSGKLEKADETYRQALKKFGQSCKVWCLYGAFCLQHDRPDQYADLPTRSLKSLPKRKHIKAITKFGQLEFKFGDAERGRTIFEGLVGTYPKRTDLWKVYIDLEIKSGTSIERIRGLFSRMMGLKLNPAKTKSILKRWYNVEKAHGDEESQQMVIQKAQSYVSSLIKPSTNGQEKASSKSSSSESDSDQLDDLPDDADD